MVDLHSIISSHHSKPSPEKSFTENGPREPKEGSYSDFPDVFFDEILVYFKLSRIEILTLSFIYREIYCRPNLARIHGMSPVISHQSMIEKLGIEPDQLYQALRSLEQFALLETVKNCQYFVRKYFLEEYDDLYGIDYDNF